MRSVYFALTITATMTVLCFIALVCLIVKGPSAEDELRAVQAHHPGAEIAHAFKSRYLVRLPDGKQLYTSVGLTDPFTCTIVLRDEPVLFQKAP